VESVFLAILLAQLVLAMPITSVRPAMLGAIYQEANASPAMATALPVQVLLQLVLVALLDGFWSELFAIQAVIPLFIPMSRMG